MAEKKGYFVGTDGKVVSIKDYTIFETKSDNWWTNGWSLNFIRDNSWEKAGLSVEKEIIGGDRWGINIGGGFLHDSRENNTEFGGVVSWRLKW